MATGRLLLAFLTTLALAPFGVADEPPAAQRDQQRRVQAEVEQTARRVTTTLRVLAYQKLDPSAEQKVLDEVAAGLRSLSREQMTAVLNHLEAAIKAPDEAAATVDWRAVRAGYRARRTRSTAKSSHRSAVCWSSSTPSSRSTRQPNG